MEFAYYNASQNKLHIENEWGFKYVLRLLELIEASGGDTRHILILGEL